MQKEEHIRISVHNRTADRCITIVLLLTNSVFFIDLFNFNDLLIAGLLCVTTRLMTDL